MRQTLVVVTDANILINLCHVGHLPVLGALEEFQFVVPDEVLAEILDPEHSATVKVALEERYLVSVKIELVEELERFATLASFLGKGEAACLALAEQRGWLVASDEGRAFRREAVRRIGADRLMNTPGILLLAIRTGVLTVAQADAAKALLEDRRFKMNFCSFRDLLGK